MAHSGTIDLGRQAKPASGRNPWQAGLALVAIAAIAVVYLATAYGLTGSNLAAKPAADRAYDQIEAQRGAVTLPATDSSYNLVEKLRGMGVIPTAAAAAAAAGWSAAQYDVARMPYAVTTGATRITSFDFKVGTPVTDGPITVTKSVTQLSSGTFHIGTPVTDGPVTAPTKGASQMTSGTFHAGTPVQAPIKRDRVGGP